MTEPRARVAGVRREALAALERVVPRRSTIALVNFPNHGNPGDSAIWLGSLSLLAELKVRIAYTAAWWNLDLDVLKASLPEGGLIVVNGGGNFGDLYRGQQDQRERLLRDARGIRIVQLPQSIRFEHPDNLARVRELIREHGAFDLMVREQASMEIAKSGLGVAAVLSPDHAFGLGPQRRATTPGIPILWNSWGPAAAEYRADSAAPTHATDVTALDWIDGSDDVRGQGGRSTRSAFRLNSEFFDAVQAGHRLTPAELIRVSKTYAPMARAWTNRGFAVLGSAQVVVTNKLHAHIFCVLTGQTHVVLDNSYGKVLATVDAWTRDLPGVHVASDASDALSMARALVESGSDV